MKLLQEIHFAYTITFLYDGDTLVGFNYGGNNYYYGIDNLGVIHYVYNEAGTVVITYTYDAWGNTVSATGDSTLINVNPIRYKSYYFDSETGFFYLQSRYYDPQVGRFVNADDWQYLGASGTVLGCNLFAYCENSPVMFWDSNGKMAGAAVAVSSSTFAAFAAWLSTIGSTNFWNPVGWIIAGILAAGVITWAGVKLYNMWKASTSSKTKTLSDKKSSIPNNRVYYLAYINSYGELIKVGKPLNFIEALAALGIPGATYSLGKIYKYDKGKSSNAQRQLEVLSSNWGIYTHDQSNAKALAVVLGYSGKPEVHGSGMYGHYHDYTHTFHIWFGGKITY